MDELTAIEMNDVNLRHYENGNPLAGLGEDVSDKYVTSPWVAYSEMQEAKPVSGPSWYDKMMYGITGDITYLPGQKAPVVVAPKTPAQKAAQDAKFEQIRMETEAASASKTAPKTLFPDYGPVPKMPWDFGYSLQDAMRSSAEGPVIVDSQKAAKDASKVIAGDLAAKIVAGDDTQDALKNCMIYNPFDQAAAQKCFSDWMKANKSGPAPGSKTVPAPDGGTDVPLPMPSLPSWAPWAAIGGLGFLMLIMAVRR